VPAPRWSRRAGAALVDRKADVVLEQGTLGIEWLRDDHVMMTGGIALAFKE
jgi:diaminopimelate epimerase